MTGLARDANGLAFRQAFFADPDARAAYGALMCEVFDIDIESRDRLWGLDPTCVPFAFFAGAACVASVEVFAYPLVLDGTLCAATALRSVAVAPAWRGQGLFRDLMLRALAWCDAAGDGPVLLYAETAALYTRFGFKPVPQHRFRGPAPLPLAGCRAARRLSRQSAEDVALIKRMLAARTAVSTHVGVAATAPFLPQVMAAQDLALDYLADADALIVTEAGDDGLILVDIVAAAIPSLSLILGALEPCRMVDVLFPPDRLDWTSAPEPDDTGLMARGLWPTAFDRPFMLPPTAEF